MKTAWFWCQQCGQVSERGANTRYCPHEGCGTRLVRIQTPSEIDSLLGCRVLARRFCVATEADLLPQRGGVS